MNIALMTTCKQRTDNNLNEVQEAINSIAKQVDKVYVVVSTDEYGENLPKLDNCEVYKVKPNLYAFKKFMPLITENFKPDDDIYLVDDDWRYHYNYAEYMKRFRANADIASLGNGGCIGAFTLFKARCIKEDFFGYWSNALIATRIDDCFMTNYFRWKRYKAQYYDRCVDELVRSVADPLIPESANNPNNTVYPRTFGFAASYKPWELKL